TRTLAVDANALRPARVRVRLMLDGAPATGARVVLRGTVPDVAGAPAVAGRTAQGMAPLVVCTSDAPGEVSAELLAGTWQLALLPQGAEPWQEIAGPAPIAVPPGAVLETTHALRRAQLRVRVLDATGQPAGMRTFFLL